MGFVVAHDTVIHYMGRKCRIPNVDPDKYSYIELLNDVVEKALNQFLGNLNILLHIWYVIPRGLGFLDIIDDKSVLEMFKLHENDLIINLH